ncbi:tRNA lysidine(34) synthetase TilS [Pseudoxanthomonas sp. SGD-10]|nr:tRNA lysidine(34) synthetase TilS [Pseudoxanthomonas sp. SGD-10]
MLSQLQTFKDYINKHALIDFDDTILLAVSGGKDSVAMTHLFHRAGYKIAIAHCNFHLRGDESDRDELFVKTLAKQIEVPFHLAHFDTTGYAEENKISIQMAARELRYNYFQEICEKFGYQKTAIAQHQNDAIETVILNLIRGTGIAGLHGIKVLRKNIIRPLMCFSQEDINNIISQGKFEFVEDSSNASDKYARNKIRLNIVPEMKILNPSLEDTFQKNIAYFSELEKFVNREIETYKNRLLTPAKDGLKIEIKKIKELSSSFFILSELLIPYGFNITSVKDILTCCTAGHSGKIFLSNDYRIIVDRQFIILERKDTSTTKFFSIEIGKQDSFTSNSGVVILQKVSSDMPQNLQDKNFCHVDTEKLVYPLILRKWSLGDKFIPFGMQGFKKVSDLLINLKVPINQKEKVLILENGDGKIIWVCGYRTDNRFKISEGTKKITTFELKNS